MSNDPRAMLMELLAARAGGGQPNAQELLLSQLGDNDPTTALLTHLLASQQVAADDEGQDDAPQEPPAPPPNTAHARRRRFERLRRTVEALYTELEALRARNDELAAAVGACCCWGDDLDCPDCGGTGTPGSAAPDQALFDHYIRPACRQMAQRRNIRRGPDTLHLPGTQHGG